MLRTMIHSSLEGIRGLYVRGSPLFRCYNATLLTSDVVSRSARLSFEPVHVDTAADKPFIVPLIVFVRVQIVKEINSLYLLYSTVGSLSMYFLGFSKLRVSLLLTWIIFSVVQDPRM